MNKILVEGEKKYHIHIDYDISYAISEYIRTQYSNSNIALIMDQNTSLNLRHELIPHLEQQGIAFKICIVNPVPKCGHSELIAALDFLAENHFEGYDLVVAFGNLELINTVAFASSIYLRGIDYISIPTSLRAMISTPANGNTGILENNKFMPIGTTYFPKAVFCDTKFLTYETKTQLHKGGPEIIKLSALYEPALLEEFTPKKKWTYSQIQSLVARCLRIQTRFSEQSLGTSFKGDFLQFGTTIARCLQLYSNFLIPPNYLTALGICMTTKASERMGFTKHGCYGKIASAVQSLELPIHYDIPKDKLFEKLSESLQSKHQVHSLILLKDLGKPMDYTIKKSALPNFFGTLYY